MSTEQPKLAWEVAINDMRCVVFAATKPKARWIAVRSYWDTGYGRGSGNWPSCRAWRVHVLDSSPLRHQPAKAWAPEFAHAYPATEGLQPPLKMLARGEDGGRVDAR